jgi:recombinational DNA repair protein (RecF pathway)
MRKDYILRRLGDAKKKRRVILFYRHCGNCGRPARFVADYTVPGGAFCYRHNSASCYQNYEYESEAEFLDALMANSEAIYNSWIE